ncbi:MAG: hypothetical protein WCO56_08230 [Verrucomicrobiota bacterium]
MQLTKIMVTLSAVLVLATGCSTHSPMRILNKVYVKYQSPTTYAAHTNKVFVTEASLENSIQRDRLGQIDVGMVVSSPKDAVLKRMANKARELGADAVIDVHIWYQPAGWSWKTPHGEGKAVRLTDRSAIDFSKMKGEWY